MKMRADRPARQTPYLLIHPQAQERAFVMPAISRIVTRFVAIALILLAVAGCTMLKPAGMEMMESAVSVETAPVPVPGEVTVEVARARPAPLEGGNGGAFLTLLNGTDQPVRLLSAASDVAANVELHETVNEGGVMKMIPQPDGFEIPAGGSVVLQPGGKHVMLLGLVKPLVEGDSFPLTLNFDNGLVVELTVPVVAMTGMAPMGADAPMTGTVEMGSAGEMTATDAMTATDMMTGTQP
jgi:copper(I)-binding protein